MVQRQIEVSAPIEDMFAVICDFESYPEFIPGTEKVVTRETAIGLEVDFTLNLIKKVEYTLKMEIDSPKKVEWHMVSGNLFKKNSGSWHLEPLGDQKTKATYTLDVSFGWMVPQKLVETLTETQLPQTLAAFKSRAEARAAA